MNEFDILYMNCHIPFPKRVALEVNRAAFRTEMLTHPINRLFWECTLRCNLNCRHCGSDCRKTACLPDPELQDLLSVLDSAPENIDRSRIMVITTGGEPLVRPDIVQVGREIRKRGYIWGMVSNGMLLTKEKFDELLQAGLECFSMSFDGFEEEHNWMRGSDVSFKRADAAIDWLVENNDVLAWDLITCVNRRNLDSLERFKEYLISRGVKRWRIFTVAPIGRAASDSELMLSDREFIGLMEFIAKTRREDRIGLEYSCEGFLGPYEGEVRNHYFNCTAGVNVASVLSDGSISGCLSIRSDFHQGNIHTDNFWDVWENGFSIYRNRKWMKKDQCGKCGVWRYCHGGALHLRGEDGKMLSCNYLKIKNG